MDTTSELILNISRVISKQREGFSRKIKPRKGIAMGRWFRALQDRHPSEYINKMAKGITRNFKTGKSGGPLLFSKTFIIKNLKLNTSETGWTWTMQPCFWLAVEGCNGLALCGEKCACSQFCKTHILQLSLNSVWMLQIQMQVLISCWRTTQYYYFDFLMNYQYPASTGKAVYVIVVAWAVLVWGKFFLLNY